MKKTLTEMAAIAAIGVGSLAIAVSAHASSVSSVDCTAPKIIINFASAVTVSASAPTSSSGLYYVGFQDGLNSGTTKEINKFAGQWDSDTDQWTIYPTRDEYEGTYNWSSTWNLHIKTIADGTTDSTPCFD